MGADHDHFGISDVSARLDHHVDVAHRIVIDDEFLPANGITVGRERRLDITRGLFQFLVAADVVLARRDRLDMPLEHAGKRALLVGQRRKRPAMGSARHTGRVVQRAIGGHEHQYEDNGAT